MLNITIGNLYNVNALADSHDYVISILFIAGACLGRSGF